jgi:hypothetical protein
MKLSDHDLRQINEEKINKLSETAELKFQKQFHSSE